MNQQQVQHATNDILYIGFDVHKNSIAIACAPGSDAGDPKFYGSCGGSNLAVERALNRICKKFGVTKKRGAHCLRGRVYRVRSRAQVAATRPRYPLRHSISHINGRVILRLTKGALRLLD